ncbi:MAG: phosphatidate cytidylyltransferase [Bacteroidales bacterium]|nr:phosphatidate cytidylyltransferase [Bacteroidales bacterium]
MNNTVKRSISGVGFIAAMLLGLLVNKYLFAVLFLFIMIVMMIEFYRMTMGDKYKWPRATAIFAGAILFVLVFMVAAFGVKVDYVGLALVPIIIVMIFSLYSKDKTEFWKFSHMYTGFLYIAVPLALSNFIAFKHGEFSGTLLLSFFIIIWASDVGAFVFGSAFGQKYGKKLFPEISPKKSWIGFWGGMLCAVLASCILKLTGMFEFPMVHAIILAIVMDIAGVYGDLFESQWKRSFDLKDSGNIIPGHGGMLDRFDSTLMAFPVGVLYMVLFNLI